jgi:hypothetical protein
VRVSSLDRELLDIQPYQIAEILSGDASYENGIT